jgi:hypothetical protein
MTKYLRYVSEAIKEEELGFLTEEEKRQLLSIGSEAVNRFSPESRAAWLTWSQQSSKRINEQTAHRKQWREDILYLLNGFDQMLQEDSGKVVTPAFYGENMNNEMKSYFNYALPVNLQKLRNNRSWVRLRTLFLQCYIMSKLNVVPFTREGDQPWKLEEKQFQELGVSLDNLYPAVSRETHLALIDSLAYNIGYGPNVFPWKYKRVKKGYLKDAPATLYLAAINVGLLTGGKDCYVWKIGITTKKDIVGSAKEGSRYSGKYQNCIKVLREKKYACGELAYIKEQTYLSRVAQEPTRSLGTKAAFSRLTESDLSSLGSSEWVLEGRPKDLAIQYFDELTKMD